MPSSGYPCENNKREMTYFNVYVANPAKRCKQKFNLLPGKYGTRILAVYSGEFYAVVFISPSLCSEKMSFSFSVAAEIHQQLRRDGSVAEKRLCAA